MHGGSPGRATVRLLGALAGSMAWLVVAAPTTAHGAAPSGPPTVGSILGEWSIQPLPAMGLLLAGAAWTWAVRRVDRAHPDTRVPVLRSVAFLGGLLAITVALLSGIDAYADSLFSVHMVQHILLTFVAAPLLAMSAPITLLLRVSSASTRRRVILPALHSRLMRVLAFPVVAWLVLAGTMWVAHISGLFEAALEIPLVHDLEHGLFLGSALLFWLPAVAQDPGPWRMTHPARSLYVFTQMPQNTFLAVVLLNATAVLYPHYATIAPAWGIAAMDDQRLAAGLMWVAGDSVFLSALAALLWTWMRAEGKATERADRRADIERIEIRRREVSLAERIALEADDRQAGRGVSR